MQTVWVNRGDHPWPHAEQPHETVSQLHELTELLR
jgi:putative hydrolase of the HAD superfamily